MGMILGGDDGFGTPYPVERETFGSLLARIELSEVRLSPDGERLHPDELQRLNAQLAPHDVEIAGFDVHAKSLRFRARAK